MLAHTVDAIRPLDAAVRTASGPPTAAVIFAGDHGVHARGVTPLPQAATVRLVADALGPGRTVIDVGVAAPLPPAPGLQGRRVRAGTRDFTAEPALTGDEARAAVEIGIGAADNAVDAGALALLARGVGVAGTAASVAVVAALTLRSVEDVLDAGPRTASEPWRGRLCTAVRDALARHRPDPADPLGMLAAVGGLEHAALTGFLLAAAAHGVTVTVLGRTARSAALVATALAPAAAGAFVTGSEVIA